MLLAMNPAEPRRVLPPGPGEAVEPVPPSRPRLRLHGLDDAGRAETESFIREVYGRRYGAVVRQFAPWLVSLHDGERIVSAAGYRLATAPLFLERYLDAPVDQLLGTVSGRWPERACIAEVGHLAATQAGQGRRLIPLLGLHLASQHVEWVVSTLTQELRHLFLRLGVTPLVLGAADPSRLGSGADDWGRYYEHEPVVLAGHLPLALRRLGVDLPDGAIGAARSAG